ncbi:MAG TPA: methyltransferase domain-containing protein [Egibacteraceae bacterium]|jgi:spermidine synthase|nr:methyltransferase domain-containing protein [Egibacteraceae bacterium]
MELSTEPYYRADLALVHHLKFGSYADRCAPGILALLEPVRRRAGLVLELGCGSGHLTRHLVAAGHRVVATDASQPLLDLARAELPEPTRWVRDITTFVRGGDGTWRRADERHDNVLVDTARLPAMLARHGVEAAVGRAFDSHALPDGLAAVVGRRPATGGSAP